MHDARMGVGAAQEGGVQHTRQIDVVHVAPRPGRQPVILPPRQWLADIAALLRRGGCHQINYQAAGSCHPERSEGPDRLVWARSFVALLLSMKKGRTASARP